MQRYASSICKNGENIFILENKGRVYWNVNQLEKYYGTGFDIDQNSDIFYDNEWWVASTHLYTLLVEGEFAKDYYEMVYKTEELNPSVGRDKAIDGYVRWLYEYEEPNYTDKDEGAKTMDRTLYLDSNGQEIDMNEESVLCPNNELDNINHPSHYTTGGMEVIDILKAKLTPDEFKGYCKGNVLKYLFRAEYKGKEKEDYQKAKWYLERLIENV